VSKALKSDVQMIDNYVNSIKNNQLIAKRANATSTTQSGQAAPDEGGTTSAAAGGGVGKKGSGGGDATAAAAGTSGTTSAVQLPNYKINDVRQSSKYIAFVARRALDGLAPRRKNEVKQPENLKAQADPATAKVIEQMVAALDKLMEETDLATPKTPAVNPALLTTEGQKKPESIDERLRNSLKTGINAIELAIGIAPANQPPAVRSAVGSQ
jgi:hypothetical protein